MPTELEHHRLDRLLGRGSWAEVWLAWHPDRPMPVAIKRAVPGSGRMPELRGEAAVLARVHHPGVVDLLDVVDDPPGVALVLAHLGGGSLRDVLDERGTLAPGEVVAVLEPVAAACAALARRGLVHGDLKPEHICFTEAGEPVLVDLGSASSIGEAPRTARSGTPAYLDPAVAAGAAPARTSEVFALAVVAYEALTGRLPHRGEPAHVLAAAAAGSHRSLRSWPAVPSAVADAVERGLDPDPAARPPEPALLVAALRAAVADHEVVRPGPARQSSMAVRRVAATDPSSTTLRFGPIPPAHPAPSRRALRAGPAAALATSVLLAGAGVAVATHAPGAATRPRRAPLPAAGPRCPSLLPPPPPGVVRRGDLDGDGCTEAARWDGATLVVATVGGARAYRIVAPGAQLVLGDWDGDGTDSPGLYDPASGVTRLIDRLPDTVGQQLGPSRVVVLARGGRAVVAPNGGSGGPDQVQVHDR